MALPQGQELVDSVWRHMKDTELYSLADLASVCGQTTRSLVPALEFLKCYGFVEQVAKSEWLLTRRLNLPAPSKVATILQATLPDCRTHFAEM